MSPFKSGLFACVLVLDAVSASAATPARHSISAEQCAALRTRAPARAVINTAELVPAGGFHLPGRPPFGPPADFSKLPAFCRIAGALHPTADSDIRFELWLPADGWNGSFLQTGNGGAAGAVLYGSLIDPLGRGYAVVNNDTGHQGPAGSFDWADGHPERMIDYGYRAVHEVTRAAKALVAAAYGSAPERSLWVGCSTGGRQGLMEARRYPADYDAIVAGAPANNLIPLFGLSVRVNAELHAADGLPPAKLGLLKEAAIAACDGLDGVVDRVIAEPARCNFDPASLTCGAGPTEHCLTPAEVASARRIYAGLVGPGGEVLIPGTGLAGEPAWAALAGPYFDIGTSFFRHVVKHDPNWSSASFDVAHDIPDAEQAYGADLNEMTGDLGRFFARRGKLITYHGTTDGLIPYRNTENYYHRLVERVGERRVREQARLYLVPGMDHCFGGEGAFAIDWLGALESWVREGRAPGVLPARHFPLPAPGSAEAAVPSKPYTRPACPYPSVARYQGSGDSSDQSAFACGTP